MSPEPENDIEQTPTELNEHEIQSAARAAAAFAQQHGFGVAFPILVASATLAHEVSPYINCWTSCGPGNG